MPRMLATSSTESSGMRRVAARRSEELYEPRRRLPEIPSSFTMASAPQFCRDQPIGVAERDALAYRQAVGFLGGVDGGIEADGGPIEPQRRDRGRQDRERLEREVDGAEQRELDELQVALVARGKLGAHGERLGETAECGGRAAADELEHVGISLLRHDRGAGGETLGKRQEAELLRGVEQHVGGEARQVLHEERDLEKQLRLGLAARELHGGDRLLYRGEAERRARRLAVDGQARSAVAGRRSQRAARQATRGRDQALRVITDLGGEASGP